MPKQIIRETIPGSSEIVFSVVHDYSRRLEWDTLLQRAEIEDAFDKAGLGAVTMCQAKAFLGGIKMRTKYVSFQPGKVAAVKILQRALGCAVDGVLGIRTLTAVNGLTAPSVLSALRLEAIAYYASIPAAKSQPYLRGWILRALA